MILERGVEVDHTTIYRLVQQNASKMEKRFRYYWRPGMGYSRRVDETRVKVKGQRNCLYRMVNKHKTANRFLSGELKDWEIPLVIIADKAAGIGAAIAELIKINFFPNDIVHRQHRGIRSR